MKVIPELAGCTVEGAYLAYQVMKDTGKIRARFVVESTKYSIYMALGARLPRSTKKWVWVDTYERAVEVRDSLAQLPVPETEKGESNGSN